MTTRAGTGPSDVKKELDTELSDSDLNDVLGLVEREINRAYSSGTSEFQSTQHRVDFEAALAALRVVEGRGRRASLESRESARIEFETSEIKNLRKRVRQRDPKNAFGHAASVRRDTDRYSAHVTPGSNQ